MNLHQAMHILGISPEDDLQTRKSKYHRLIARYHPDNLGSDARDGHTFAQLINEAYQVVQSAFCAAPSVSQNADSLWKQIQTPELFADRDIYIAHEIYGEIYESHIATGKYLWDPEMEDFSLYLKSIHQLCRDLLDQKYGLSDSELSSLQITLFQALSEHYMDPASCLLKLLKPEKTDKDGRSYLRLRAHLGAKRSDSSYRSLCKLHSGQHLYPQALQNNRLLVRDETGASLGHLSLEKDAHYLCLIPLLREKKAQIRMHVKEIHSLPRHPSLHVQADVDLEIRLSPMTETHKYGQEVHDIYRLLNSL